MKKLLGRIEDYKIRKSPAHVNTGDVTHFDVPKKVVLATDEARGIKKGVLSWLLFSPH